MGSSEDLDQALDTAIAHGRGPALLIGSAGAGRTEALARRLERLLTSGLKSESVLTCCESLAGREALRSRAEAVMGAPRHEFWIETWGSLSERLLREYALEAGLDPFFEVAGPADQLAVMLDRLAQLPLRRHQIRGNPSGLLTRLLERIDALKREGIGPTELRERARGLEREADGRASREAARKELEFADLFEAHDAIMRERGSVDASELVLELGRLLRGQADVAAAVAERFPYLMVDELEDVPGAAGALIGLIAAHGNVVAAADVDQGLGAFLAAGERGSAAFLAAFPEAELIHLEPSHRGTEGIQSARKVICGLVPESYRELDPVEVVTDGGDEGAWSDDSVRLWRCANERAEAQAVAREIERVLAAGEAAAEEICIVTSSRGPGGRLVAGALEERGVPFRSAGSAAYFHRAEVRDAIAWLRALVDPTDSSAAVRALTRPPVDLRSVDLARCTTIARRRKLDMISAVEAALESPQLPPPSRDRIRAFLKLYRAAAAAMDTLRPDAFVRRLIERVGFRRHGLFGASPETAERLVNLARLAELASSWSRRRPDGSTREFVAYLAAVAEAGRRFSTPLEAPPAEFVFLAEPDQIKGMEFERVYLVGLDRGSFTEGAASAEWIPEELAVGGRLPPAGADVGEALAARRAYLAAGRARSMLVLSYPEQSGSAAGHSSAIYEEVRASLELEEEAHEEELFGPAEGLHSTYRMIRDEVLEASWRAGAALSEMRLDTPEDVNRAVARFYELLKLAALIQRPGGEPEREALDGLNELLRRVATPEQIAELERSSLDDYIVTERTERERRRSQLDRRGEPGLEAFIPKRGGGIGLSASDVDLYRTCPLKYKFARVFAIPQEPTINLRFGILVHNVLQAFHAEEIRDAPSEEGGIRRLLDLFEAGWRRTGFGSTDDEMQYRDRAIAALARYHERHVSGAATPIWLERGFSFDIGGHNVRGRIDRVDRHPDGSYELIDYKTGPAKRAEDLDDDVQIALYRLAVSEDWGVEAADGSYWYVLDDEKITAAGDPADLDRVRGIILDVAEGISSQDFEPKPEFESCSWCDYRLICPASEA